VKPVSIQKQILRLAFVPLFVGTLSLEAFFLYGYYEDMKHALITHEIFVGLLLQGGAITALLLGVSYYLLTLASRRIIAPLINLSADVRVTAQGLLGTPDTVSSLVFELSPLVLAINMLTEKSQREHEIFQQQIVETTQVLRDKKEIAERANQNSSRFLAVASHELRQPLHAIGLYVSELQRKVFNTELQNLVEQVNHSVEVLTQMLNGLLDISKLDARSIVPQIQVFSMAGVLERVTANHIIQARNKNIRLVVRPCSCFVSSDPLLVERIVMNLVSNAIRYTGENGRVLVACRHRGQKLCIEVRDNGIGIAKEDQDNIFREFHQCKQPHLDTEKGLGLGLAIVDRLAQLLQHKLSLRSKPNVGTVFTLEVPSALTPEKSSDQNPAQKPVIPAISNLIGKKLLVVDDDPLVLESTVHILASWGCVMSSADSMAGVNLMLAEGREWDLIISDYQLEENITGLDVIKAIKQHLNPNIPCILITGNTSQEISKLVALGGDRILYKPVRPAKLRSLIEFLLKEGVQ